MERKTVYITAAISVIMLVLLSTGLLVYFLTGHEVLPLKPGPKLVIDHDGGADDAMAIFMALLYEKYFGGPPILGLTTTHGNVKEPQVFSNSQRILGIANRRDVPVYRGSNFSIVSTFPTDFYFGQDGLGDLDNVVYQEIEAQPEHAAFALIDLSKKYPGELVVVAIGALTNIALAIRLDPHFISRLSQLYVAAGNIYSIEHPQPEFNAQIDVESYYVVAENSSPNKVTVIPFSQILDSQNISMEWRENVLGSIQSKIMTEQNSFERISNDGEKIWAFLDPAAMGIVLDQCLVNETKYSDNSIILCGNQRGINTNNFTTLSEANVKVVYSTSEEAYKKLLIDIFSAELP